MSSPKPTILCEIDLNGVATITLNRPEYHHALDKNMILSFIEHLESLAHNAKIRILIIRASGKTFCAGADLQWMRNCVHYSREENEIDAKPLATMMHKLSTFNKPTLAMVQGPAYGGGLGLIACCKIAIASTEASFCFSEVKLGIIPAIIGPYIIRAIGARHALAYFLSGQSFSAHTAMMMGLCSAVVPPEQLETIATEWIQALLSAAPLAQQAATHFIEAYFPPLSSEIVNKTTQIMANLRISPEGQEGLQAFLDKRKPYWAP